MGVRNKSGLRVRVGIIGCVEGSVQGVGVDGKECVRFCVLGIECVAEPSSESGLVKGLIMVLEKSSGLSTRLFRGCEDTEWKSGVESSEYVRLGGVDREQDCCLVWIGV